MHWSDPIMVNVVITGRLRRPHSESDEDEVLDAGGVTFDLAALAPQLMNVEYHPAKFAALKVARLDPFSKGLFFRSGKLVCVGNVSVALARESIQWFADTLMALVDEPLLLDSIVVQNIVATSHLGGNVPLVRFAKRWNRHAQYEPELFPGCPIRHPSLPSTVVVVLFSTGKMNVTGAKNADDVRRAAELVACLLRRCMLE